MHNNQQRINEIGRLIKKYRNRARTANRQRKWAEERRCLEKIQALNIERKNLQEHAPQPRGGGAPPSTRVIKRIKILMNEIARDTRILERFKAENNQQGVKKYQRIVQNKKAKLAALQGRQQPTAPAGGGPNNNRRIRILLNEIKRDRSILERHKQAGNAAGVTKYEGIIRNQLAELQRLRGSNQGPGGTGGVQPPAPPPPPQTGTGGTAGSNTRAEVKKIADAFKASNRRDNDVDKALNQVIDLLLKKPQFSALVAARDQLFRVRGNATLPPEGSVIDQPFIRDVFKITESNITLKGYTIKDSIVDSDFAKAFDRIVNDINQMVGNGQKNLSVFKKLAHRDAFQLIPQDRNISRGRSQFAGAKLDNITLENISIHSNGSLQGIFSSDGAFENLNFKNISVDTQSAHQIAIFGMLSGTLDLTNNNGAPVEVKLYPLRLGGGRNILVTGFSAGSSYQYGAIDSGTSNANIIDKRQQKRAGAKHYINFDMDGFIGLIRANPTDDLQTFLDLIERSAEQSGDLDS